MDGDWDSEEELGMVGCRLIDEEGETKRLRRHICARAATQMRENHAGEDARTLGSTQLLRIEHKRRLGTAH